MGIMNLMRHYKADARQRATRRNIIKAEGLKALKEERIRLEGQQKVRDSERKEKGMIAEIKRKERRYKTEKIRSGLKVVTSGIQQLKKTSSLFDDDDKKKKKKKKNNVWNVESKNVW